MSNISRHVCTHAYNYHSHIKDEYVYCERCNKVCSHHFGIKDVERYTTNMRKRILFCRGGHDVEDKDLRFDKFNNAFCNLHSDKTKRWKVKSERGK